MNTMQENKQQRVQLAERTVFLSKLLQVATEHDDKEKTKQYIQSIGTTLNQIAFSLHQGE